jgi:hemolysin D
MVQQSLMQLTAPVAGTVQQLKVHTVGGVVTTAQSLMEIVPKDALEVDATIRNQDIGFVNEGQAAMVKIETFPYTRYGYLIGKVIKISNDATQDKKQGLVFAARIQLPTNKFKVGNKWVNLTPGMAVTAGIKTGKQKVWHYFLSSLIETGKESLREW